jgi:hypothetical protein
MDRPPRQYAGRSYPLYIGVETRILRSHVYFVEEVDLLGSLGIVVIAKSLHVVIVTSHFVPDIRRNCIG